jgi:hypothetical protein
MTHLEDTTPAASRRPLGDSSGDRRTGATCSRQRDAQYQTRRDGRLVSRSPDANFLEFIRAGFHYSVIARDGASRLAAGLCFGGPAALKTSRRRLRVRLHREMMDRASTRSRQFRFRTGDRKTECPRVQKMPSPDDAERSDREGYLMRFAKNIPAKLPSCATIAPILHAEMHVTPERRGINLNIGAADADGR